LKSPLGGLPPGVCRRGRSTPPADADVGRYAAPAEGYWARFQPQDREKWFYEKALGPTWASGTLVLPPPRDGAHPTGIRPSAPLPAEQVI